MLMTILLMAIVLLAITGGIMVARNTYREISRKADAQTLLSTTISAVTEDISGAADFRTYTASGGSGANGGFSTLSFKTPNRGYRIVYRNAGYGGSGSGTKNGIYVVPMTGGSKPDTGKEVPLVTEKTETLDLYTEITLTNGDTEASKGDPVSVVKAEIQVFSHSMGNGEPVEKGVVYIRTAES